MTHCEDTMMVIFSFIVLSLVLGFIILLSNHDDTPPQSEFERNAALLRQNIEDAVHYSYTNQTGDKSLLILSGQGGTSSHPFNQMSFDQQRLYFVRLIQLFNEMPFEWQYLHIVRLILDHGQPRADRTGTGTLAIFSPPQIRVDLSRGVFPLLTTKRVGFRLIAEELLWMISGCTDAKVLDAKGVKIWNDNGTREFLDNLGFYARKEGDLGPIYGFQWRHAGAEYVDCETDYRGKGFDQLADVINKIRNKPTDRRIMMSAWNVKGICSVCFVINWICTKMRSRNRPSTDGAPAMPRALPVLCVHTKIVV